MGSMHSNRQDTHLLDSGHHSLPVQTSFLPRVADMDMNYYTTKEGLYSLVSVKNSQGILTVKEVGGGDQEVEDSVPHVPLEPCGKGQRDGEIEPKSFYKTQPW